VLRCVAGPIMTATMARMSSSMGFTSFWNTYTGDSYQKRRLQMPCLPLFPAINVEPLIQDEVLPISNSFAWNATTSGAN